MKHVSEEDSSELMMTYDNFDDLKYLTYFHIQPSSQRPVLFSFMGTYPSNQLSRSLKRSQRHEEAVTEMPQNVALTM